ncbi:MAG: ShlB/FhaC/HecB family hemolysin secretion/activation protein [Microcystaceae cyanobacterium]
MFFISINRWFESFSVIILFVLILTDGQLTPLNAQPLEESSPLPSITPLPTTPLPLTPSPIVPPNESIPDIPEKITVKDFSFEGNTAFSEAQLTKVVQDYLNRPLSFAELLEARTAITQYYIDQGYVTSGAYIPPQTINEGMVTIAIVEGKLTDINVTVEGKLNPDYIRNRIALASQTPLNVNRLLESLQLLQLDPLIDSISTELSAGIEPGTSILTVNAVTANSFHFQVLLDNGRNPQVGSFRRGAEIRDDNLLGIGDSIRGSYRNTDGSDDINVAYRIPFTPRNGTVEVEFRNLTGKIIEEPFDVLDLASDYQKYALRIRHPVIRKPNQELALGIGFDYQNSFSRTPFFPITSSGSDENGRTKATFIRFNQEWLQRGEKQVLAARSEFNFGIDALGTTTPFDVRINPDAPNPNAFFWRGQSQWVRRLAPETLFVLQGDVQLAGSPIVPLEQFAIGGLGSVVGYRQNTLLTDNGLFLGAEVRYPLYYDDINDTVIHLVPFVQFGHGWNNGEFNPSIDTLASVGMGLQWRYKDLFNARLDVGIPLGRVPFEGNTWQDKGIMFTIIMGP